MTINKNQHIDPHLLGWKEMWAGEILEQILIKYSRKKKQLTENLLGRKEKTTELEEISDIVLGPT